MLLATHITHMQIGSSSAQPRTSRMVHAVRQSCPCVGRRRTHARERARVGREGHLLCVLYLSVMSVDSVLYVNVSIRPSSMQIVCYVRHRHMKSSSSSSYFRSCCFSTPGRNSPNSSAPSRPSGGDKSSSLSCRPTAFSCSGPPSPS